MDAPAPSPGTSPGTPQPMPAPSAAPAGGAAPAPKKDKFTDGSYIRTFAKDYEKITGKPAPGGKLVVSKKEMSPPKVVKTLEEELAPSSEGAVAEARDIRNSKKEKVFSIDGARADILARLKANVGIKSEAPKKQEVPPKRIVMPPVPVPPTPIPITEKKKDDFLSPLHTFKTDFSEKVGRERASKISILAAESDVRTSARPVARKPSGVNLLPVMVGIVLLFGGGAGVYFALKFSSTAPVVPQESRVPSLIFADSSKELSGKGAELMQALSEVAYTPTPDRSVVVTYISGTDSAASTTGARVPLPGGALIKALSLKAPDILLRNVEPDSTVGIIRSGGEARVFFILHVSSYERAFAGMLAWEDSIARELRLLYPVYQTSPFLTDTASTTGATSTIPKGQTTVVPQVAAPQGFTDEVVSNHDVRILYDAQRKIIMMYGFRDKNTLVIARDKASFSALFDRLSATR